MKTDWDHLPNAEHIDRILADLRNRTKAWAAVGDTVMDTIEEATRDAAWDAVGDTVMDTIEEATRDAAWAAARDAARAAARNVERTEEMAAVKDAAWASLFALVAWDHAALYLKLPPEQVLMLARLGVNEAVLMYPAVLALNTEEKENAL